MSGTLPTWMERLLGLPVRPGMGTAWRLEARWPLPAWATLLLAAGLAMAVVCVYLRESGRTGRGFRLALASVRLGLIGLVLAMAAQMGLVLQRTGLPFLVVIIDDTRSMNTVDHYDDALRKSLEARVAAALSPGAPLSRWNVARSVFTENDGELLKAITNGCKLRLYFLSDFRESRAAGVPGIVAELKSAEAKGECTRLGAAIRSALDELRGTTPVAVVVASDGINTQGPGLRDAAAYARQKGVPLYFVGAGSDRAAPGLRLSELEVEDSVFVNDVVHFRFNITTNAFQGKTVRIFLKRQSSAGGSETTDEIVGRADVTVIADGRPQQVVMPYRPTQPGNFRFKIEVEQGARSTGQASERSDGRRNGDGKPLEGGTSGMPPGHSLAGRGTTITEPEDATATQPLAAKIVVSEGRIRVPAGRRIAALRMALPLFDAKP